MDLKNKIEEWKTHYEEVTLTDLLSWYKKLLRRLPDISHLKNVVLFGSLATLVIFILFVQRFSYLYDYVPKEPVYGGTYEEGVVGKIEQLNPLYSPLNSAESSATALIFSGLTKEGNNRKNIPDLAEKWEVDAAGTNYKFFLRPNLFWHDGQKLTADDVAFTIDTIQNPDTKSPYLKIWEGVEYQVNGEREISFKLKGPYAAFISETDLPIIPKHLLEKVPGRTLRISEFSKKPIGSGPYQFVEFKEGEETQVVILKANENYHEKKPYIEKFYLKSYPSTQRLGEAYAKKEVKGTERVEADSKRQKMANIKFYQLSIPSYDVLYFNLRSGFGQDKNFRDAISLAINRADIVNQVYHGDAIAIYGPILPGFTGHDGKQKKVYNYTEAKKILEKGYVLKNGELTKDGKKVSVRLLTVDSVVKKRQAKVIEEALKNLGIEVSVEPKNMADLSQNHIRPRNYDLLLISQNLGTDPDLYPFWHSTQANDPGLNFSGYSNRLLDKYLEQARASLDENTRKSRYLEASKIIFAETPAVFLTSPSYIYGVSREVKGIESMKLSDPKNRFWNVANWYILDRREN